METLAIDAAYITLGHDSIGNLMSLTNQIKDNNSPVRQFFTEFEKKDGMKKCLALLQSTTPIQPLSFIPSSLAVHKLIGTTTDYLIRYTANGNNLQFDNTIASQAIFRAGFTDSPFEENRNQEIMENLFKIGKQNLDGRIATDYKAIYSATALSVMDGFFRSGRLPQLFVEPIQEDKQQAIEKLNEEDFSEKTTNYLFSEYFANLGGEQYAQDISDLIQLFIKARQDLESELFGAKIVVSNQALKNSGLVGGADFDCVIESKNRLALTDIKTTTKPITIEHLRQIIGYALLYDENKDDFKFTDIGIYHSRSGSFRSLPIGSVIEMVLTNFKSVDEARKAFIEMVKKRGKSQAAPSGRPANKRLKLA